MRVIIAKGYNSVAALTDLGYERKIIVTEKEVKSGLIKNWELEMVFLYDGAEVYIGDLPKGIRLVKQLVHGEDK